MDWCPGKRRRSKEGSLGTFEHLSPTLVVQVALSGSTSLSSLCRTALGHREDSLASMRNVNICKQKP